MSHEIHNFNGWPCIKWWNIIQINCVAITRDRGGIILCNMANYLMRRQCLKYIRMYLIVKMQNICSLLGWNNVHNSDIFNHIQWNMKRKKVRWGYAKHLNLLLPKPYNCRYRANQHLIVLNLDSVSINKIRATEFLTVKVL